MFGSVLQGLCCHVQFDPTGGVGYGITQSVVAQQVQALNLISQGSGFDSAPQAQVQSFAEQRLEAEADAMATHRRVRQRTSEQQDKSFVSESPFDDSPTLSEVEGKIQGSGSLAAQALLQHAAGLHLAQREGEDTDEAMETPRASDAERAIKL